MLKILKEVKVKIYERTCLKFFFARFTDLTKTEHTITKNEKNI